MKKGTKVLLLSLMLIFPVLIYLFLQAFGENKYDLPVYPEQLVEVNDCGVFDSGYRLDTLHCRAADGGTFGFALTDANYLLHFPDPDKRIQNQEANELRRFLQKSGSISFRIVTFVPVADSVFWNRQAAALTTNDWLVTSACTYGLKEMMECQLLLPVAEIKARASSSRLVLIDSESRLRGFYVPSDKEDVDRLTVEMKILQTVQEQEK